MNHLAMTKAAAQKMKREEKLAKLTEKRLKVMEVTQDWINGRATYEQVKQARLDKYIAGRRWGEAWRVHEGYTR